jgi:hypothetical protein
MAQGFSPLGQGRHLAGMKRSQEEGLRPMGVGL